MLRFLWPIILFGLLSAPAVTLAVQSLPPDWPLTESGADTSGFALILGGGGARGLAHLGVIEVLEELGMRPSLVVGTSAGAVVGALYASGWSSAELNTLALEGDLLDLFINLEAPQAELQGGWWGPPPHQFSLQISQWPPLPEKGISYGPGFESMLGRSTADALFKAGNNFNHLPIAFHCVSTDLLTYSLVVHDRGQLPRAVKASSTIPVIFYPVELEGKTLVDGGFLDNLPVQVARRLGFKRAVLVDVSNVHLPNKENPEDIYEMWIRVAELNTVFPNDYSVGDEDVLLRMPLEPYRSFSLESAPEIIDVGRKLTWQNREKLLALRDACGPVARRPAPEATQLGPVTLRNIEVRGLQRMSSDRVLDRLHIHAGDRLELETVWNKGQWLAQEGSFHTIGFDFIPVADDTADVVVHIQEETKPKLELGASVITDDGVAVMARLRQENIFGRAGLGLLSYRYSDRNASLRGLLGQANGSGWLGLRTRLLWQRERPGVYENGVEVDQFAMRRTQVGLDLAIRDFRHGWSLYLGGDMGQINSYLESRSVAGSGDQSLRTMHLTLESHGRELPLAQGNRGVRIRHVRSFDQADDEPSWWRTDLGIVMPVGGLGDWTPVWALGAVVSSSDIPVVHQGRAGGPRGWIGMRRQEVIAPQFVWSRLGLKYSFGTRIYLEFAGAVGWYGEDDLRDARPVWGGGFGVGVDSFMGPMRLGFAVGEDRPGYVYLQVGHQF